MANGIDSSPVGDVGKKESVPRWSLFGQRFMNGLWYLIDLGDSNPNMRESPHPFFKLGVELIMEGLESGDAKNKDLKLGLEMLPPELLHEAKKSSPAKFLYRLHAYDPRFSALTEDMIELLFRVIRKSRGQPPKDETIKTTRYLTAHPEVGKELKAKDKGVRKKVVDRICMEVFGSKHTAHRPHVRRVLNQRYPVKPKPKI